MECCTESEKVNGCVGRERLSVLRSFTLTAGWWELWQLSITWEDHTDIVSLGRDQNSNSNECVSLLYHRKVKKLSVEPSKVGNYLYSLLIPEIISVEGYGIGRRLLCMDCLMFLSVRLYWCIICIIYKKWRKEKGFGILKLNRLWF